VETEEAEAATTDDSHRSLALVGADREERAAPARAGDAKAVGREVGRLFAEHGRMVFALCNVLLCNREEAEDATQQCFLSAQKSMLAGTVPTDAAAWLAAIARNECLSRLRRRRPATVALRDDDLLTDTDVADLVDRRTEIAALSEAIAGLPPAQRQAVVLRDFYGLSYHEVSVALGVTGPAVESLLFKSRKRLQDRLRPFHAASGIAAVPAVVREALSRAIPGFSSGLPRAGAGQAAAGMGAKLVSGKAAATVAVLAVTAGAGTMALTHATLFQRSSRPAPPVAVARPAAVGPDVALAAPVNRPPDAIARPLRLTHLVRRARKPAVAKVVAPPPAQVVQAAPPPTPTPTSTPQPAAAKVPRIVARTPSGRVTPTVVIPEASGSFRSTSPPVIRVPKTPPLPTETTPEPAEGHDSGGGGTVTPSPSSGSPAPVSGDPAGTGSGGDTTGIASSSPDDSSQPSVGGSNDGHDQATTATTTTTQSGDDHSGRHHDGDSGSSPESESNGGPTTTATVTTTTTDATTTSDT
jgi:RNA polymerase sigma-70 factor (ECF subfamily)